MSQPPAYTDVPPNYDTDKALAIINALTPEQTAKLKVGIAQTISSDDGTPHLKDAALTAAQAVQNVDDMFVALKAKLTSLQSTGAFGNDPGKFLSNFDTVQQDFRSVITDSHSLAVSIAQYGESFEKIIVKFCADTRFTVDQRIAKIQQFISEGDAIKASAEAMKTRFDGLKDEFAEFVGSFSAWAKDKETEDQDKIQGLENEIAEINKTIADIDTALLALGLALAGTVVATGVAGWLALAFFPPLAPFILWGGLIAAGLEVATLAGLAIARAVKVAEKTKKEQQISDINKELKLIAATRSDLENVGKVDLELFTQNITVIAGTWVNVQNDATDIHGWLQDGADFADAPEYMKMFLDEGVTVYQGMAKYLKEYANGVTESVTSFK